MTEIEKKVLLLEHQQDTQTRTLDEIRRDVKELLIESRERQLLLNETVRRLNEIEPTVKATANGMLFVRMSRYFALLLIGFLTVTTDLWTTIAKFIRITKG